LAAGPRASAPTTLRDPICHPIQTRSDTPRGRPSRTAVASSAPERGHVTPAEPVSPARAPRRAPGHAQGRGHAEAGTQRESSAAQTMSVRAAAAATSWERHAQRPRASPSVLRAPAQPSLRVASRTSPPHAGGGGARGCGRALLLLWCRPSFNEPVPQSRGEGGPDEGSRASDGRRVGGGAARARRRLRATAPTPQLRLSPPTVPRPTAAPPEHSSRWSGSGDGRPSTHHTGGAGNGKRGFFFPQLLQPGHASLRCPAKIQDLVRHEHHRGRACFQIDRTPRVPSPPEPLSRFGRLVANTGEGTRSPHRRDLGGQRPAYGTFDGPGQPQLVGTGRDNAGNVGTGSFNIPFDASHAAVLRRVKATAGNRSATDQVAAVVPTRAHQWLRDGCRGAASSPVQRPGQAISKTLALQRSHLPYTRSRSSPKRAKGPRS